MTATPLEVLTLDRLQTPMGPILIATDAEGRVCAPSISTTTKPACAACSPSNTARSPPTSANRPPRSAAPSRTITPAISAPWSTSRWRPGRHRLPAQGLGGPAAHPRPARPAATASWPRRSASPRPCAPWVWPMAKSGRHRGPLPPGDRRRRLPHRLRRRPAAQALAAAPRGRGVQGKSFRPPAARTGVRPGARIGRRGRSARRAGLNRPPHRRP